MSLARANLAAWKESLCSSFEVGGLYSRNPLAHKWKAPFRSILLRESVAWRTQDLLSQSLVLHDLRHALGARILARSALETLAVLIYLNQMTRKVLASQLGFQDFSTKTSQLVLGSRNESTSVTAINIISVLNKCKDRYPQIDKLYADLSESAHPNYEGMSLGYKNIDHETHTINFSNKWSEMFGKQQIGLIELCGEVFDHEYNVEWPDAFARLENWIADNDAALEANKELAK